MVAVYRKTFCGGKDLTMKLAVSKLKISPIEKQIYDEIEKKERLNIMYFD